MGGGQPNLSQEHIRQIRIPAPPLAEQHTIVDYLDQETSRIDLVRTKTQQSITRLHELRSALITAAVTGQIDIDEWERRGETDRRLEQLEAGEARPEEAPV